MAPDQWFYGVTPSMAARALLNLRYVTKEQFEQMDEANNTSAAMPLKDALGLPEHHFESGRDAFRSRLLALTVENLNRGLITHDEFLEATSLVELAESQRDALLSQVSTKRRQAKGKRRIPGQSEAIVGGVSAKGEKTGSVGG